MFAVSASLAVQQWFNGYAGGAAGGAGGGGLLDKVAVPRCIVGGEGGPEGWDSDGGEDAEGVALVWVAVVGAEAGGVWRARPLGEGRVGEYVELRRVGDSG